MAVVALAAAGGAWSVVAAQDLQGWMVNSSVSAVQLVRVEQVRSTTTGAELVFHIKNISRGPVSAVAVTTPDGGNHLRDYFGREPLAPGATYSLSVTLRDTPASERILGISALIFADGRVEGDPPQIEFIKAYRIGTALETERIRRVLDTLGSEEVLRPPTVASMIEALGNPPRSAEEAVESVREFSGNHAAAFEAVIRDQKTRFALWGGVTDTRQNVRRQLADIGEHRATSRSESTQTGTEGSLSAFRTRIRALSAKQRAELEAMR